MTKTPRQTQIDTAMQAVADALVDVFDIIDFEITTPGGHVVDLQATYTRVDPILLVQGLEGSARRVRFGAHDRMLLGAPVPDSSEYEAVGEIVDVIVGKATELLRSAPTNNVTVTAEHRQAAVTRMTAGVDAALNRSASPAVPDRPAPPAVRFTVAEYGGPRMRAADLPPSLLTQAAARPTVL